MSTALPAAPRRAIDAFGSTQFQAVDRYQYGDGFVDREAAAYTIRTQPDGPAVTLGQFFDAMRATFDGLRRGCWGVVEAFVRDIRTRQAPRVWRSPDGPELSEYDAMMMAKIVGTHLRNSNATTAANSVRGWLVRGWFDEVEEITAESDFRTLTLCAKTKNALESHWENSERPPTVGELSAALDEWLANPAARPRTIANAAEAEIRDELLRVELLGPAQRANGKRCGQGAKKSEVA